MFDTELVDEILSQILTAAHLLREDPKTSLSLMIFLFPMQGLISLTLFA